MMMKTLIGAAAAMILALTGTGVYFATAKATPPADGGSCCQPCAACCEPTSGCCETGSCCTPDAKCCYPGAACCEAATQVKAEAKKGCCDGGKCCEEKE